MDHLPGDIVDHDRPSGGRVDVPRCGMSRGHVVHGRELRSVRDGLRDLAGRPAPLAHFALPLLGRMIATEPPTWLTRSVAWVIHRQLTASREVRMCDSLGEP